jgi:hypothetical protein
MKLNRAPDRAIEHRSIGQLGGNRTHNELVLVRINRNFLKRGANLKSSVFGKNAD